MKNSLCSQKKQYVKEISRSIPNDLPDKDRVLQAIAQNLEDYLSECPDASSKDISEHFGQPSEFAASFMENCSGTEISLALKKRRRQNHVFAGICVLLALAALFLYGSFRFWVARLEIKHNPTVYYYHGREVTYGEFMKLQQEEWDEESFSK